MTPAYQEGYDAGQKLCSLGVKSENKYSSGIERIDWDEGYQTALDDYDQTEAYGGFV
jgi:hypothetical protein